MEIILQQQFVQHEGTGYEMQTNSLAVATWRFCPAGCRGDGWQEGRGLRKVVLGHCLACEEAGERVEYHP